MVTDVEPVEAPLSERKYLTFLFVDIQQSTELVAELDPEEALSLLEPALQVMRDAVRRHGGIVSKELGDGIKALFGAPLSNAWHAVMGCRAALEIIDGIAREGDARIQVRCGVHSHYAVTRTTRGDYSSVYDATGPAAHLANRLQSAAGPGEVYVSETCRALCESMFEFEALPAVVAKGFPHPVAMHRVVRARARSLWQARAAHSFTPFNGRSDEIRILHDAAHAAGDAAHIVAVLGEAGMGKSRFVQEFLDSLVPADWTIAAVACHPSRAATPFGVVADLLVQLHSTLANVGSDQHVGPDVLCGQLAPHLRSALATVIDRPVDDPAWSELEPSQRLSLISDVVAQLFALAVVARPVAAFIDDTQWMDRQSAEVLKSARKFAGRHRFLLIFASRQENQVDWLDGAQATIIWLRPLANAAGRAILDSVLGPSPSLARLKKRILHHTGGVPLFIEEVVRYLTQAGILTRRLGDRELVDAFDTLEVPPSVLGVIAERIDRLGVRPKTLLQAASVIGAQITVPMLHAVTSAEEADLALDLATLEAAGVLVATASSNVHSFEFTHDLIREVAYESILTRDREAGHRRVLAELETTPALETAEVLCHHAQRASDWVKLTHYAQEAARRSFARSAMYETARYVELAALALDRQPSSLAREEQAIDLRLEARNSLPAIGRFDTWMSFAAEALERAIGIGDAARQLAARVELAAAANFLCDPPEALRFGLAAVEEAEGANSLHWQFRAEYALAQAYLTAGWYRSAACYFDQALVHLAAAEQAGEPRAMTLRYSVLCWMMNAVARSAMGDLEQGDQAQCRASELAAVSGRPYELIAASYGRGYYAVQAGRYDEAGAALSQGLDLAETYAVRQFSPVLTCQLGKLQLLTGKTELARSVLQDARDAARAVGHTLSELRACTYLAIADASAGERDAALQDVRAATATCRRRGLEGVLAEALLVEAAIRLLYSAPNAALIFGLAQEASSIAARTGAQPLLVAARQVQEAQRDHLVRGDSTAPEILLPFGVGE